MPAQHSPAFPRIDINTALAELARGRRPQVTEQHKAQLRKRRYPTRLRREGQRTYTGAIIGCSLLGAGALITT